MLFVGTKKQAQDAVQSYAEKCGMPYVNERWLGGMLTNFETISKRVAKMKEYQRMRDSGEFEAMPKKEALLIGRELEKLERNLGGIRDMERLPDAVFVLDTKKEHIAVTEANKLGIPIVAVVDTNCDPDVIQYVIPGNDDAIRSGTLMCRVIADAVEEGRFIASRRHGNGAGPAAADPQRRSRRPRSRPSRPRPAARRPLAAQEREARVAARAAGPAEQTRGRDRGAGRSGGRPSPASAPRTPRTCSTTPPRSPRPRSRPSPPPTPPTPTRPPRPRPSTRGGLTMPDFTAKDVQALRQATGAGMMDAKKALAGERRRHGGRRAVAAREGPGQGGQARRPRERAGRGGGGRSTATSAPSSSSSARPTSSAKSDDFTSLVQDLADAGAGQGRPTPSAERADRARRPQDHARRRTSSSAGSSASRPADGNVLDSYLHIQDGRGVNAVLVELAGGTRELAHDIAVHIAFAKPAVPDPRRGARPTSSRRSARRCSSITKAEGKPEQAWPKIVEGRLNAWFKDQVLLEQGFVARRQEVDHRSCSAAPPSCASPRSYIGS